MARLARGLEGIFYFYVVTALEYSGYCLIHPLGVRFCCHITRRQRRGLKVSFP